MLTFDQMLARGAILAVALVGVAVWARTKRAQAHALEADGKAREAQALHDRLDALTPAVVLVVVLVATMMLVA